MGHINNLYDFHNPQYTMWSYIDSFLILIASYIDRSVPILVR